MLLHELDWWRKRIPIFIFAACAIPWVLVKAKNGEEFKWYYDTLVTVIAAPLGFFYVGLNVRGALWDEEMEMHVRTQIRRAILELVPKDLAVTEAEKHRLLEREIYKKLAGVFWETVDEDPKLQAQKQHFYSNGIVYSTSFDVFVICGLSAVFVYSDIAMATRLIEFVYVAAILLVISFLSIFWVMPKCRARHLELSDEQLELIRRVHSASVAEKFRTIVLEWRNRE
ncbi:MAG TPA: hypothetical protein VMU53_18560 [Candidatus Sulfotelmatobacter sp.]|nr:hypothetical protein [Candidatus Sulfotelmatobacter sp.]